MPSASTTPSTTSPGMLLIEAARQAAQAVRHPAPVLPVTMETAFRRYVEFDTPCWTEARPLNADGDTDTDTVRVVARQDDEVRFTADVRTRARCDGQA
ncbi:AfsA-related hotdog domain-containing protein [Streptomyces sp. NPDC006602]|uniref:AfsA-related hotdog domain-containing protein n=1 Tax=Streptomyces sp. NPDC006602 TaxID=3364751 RepID=UPI00367B3414